MTICDLSVIVICKNNAGVLEANDRELTSVLATLGLNTEVIYVDNGSLDDTVFRLKRLIQQPTSITRRLVILRREFGSTSAFLAGVAHSSGRFILAIDPLLTVDPVEIVRLLAEIEEGYDVVSARRKREHLGPFVRLRSQIFNTVTGRVTGLHLRDFGTPCRLIRREILSDIQLHGEMFAFLPVFARATGAQIVEISVTYRPTHYVGREYTIQSMTGSFLDLITVWFLIRYSTRPMHLFGSLGILFILASVLALGIAIANRITTQVSLIQTPLPTLSGILLAIGLLTMLLGLTTEILIRSYFEVQNKPTYSVREVFERASQREN